MLQAVTTGVFKRLSNLTLVTAESVYKTVDALYPKHADTLKEASLAPKKYFTLEKMVKGIEKEGKSKKGKKKRKNQY